MRDYGWSDENRVAVAERPLSVKEHDAKIRQVAEREQRRVAERVKIRQRIAANAQAEDDVAELAVKRDDATAELERLQRHLTLLEATIDGSENDDAVFSQQAAIAEQITRLRAQRDAFNRQYLIAARSIDPTTTGDLFHTGRADLVARQKVCNVVCTHLERGLNGLRSDRGRYSAEQFAILENAYQVELADARSRATEATACVLDE